MKIIRIDDKNRGSYEKFLDPHPLANIHQTWEWGLFQSKSSLRDRFWLFAAENTANSPVPHQAPGRIMASALVIRQKLPFGKCWLYCPRGPLGDYSTAGEGALKELFARIALLAKEEGAVFFRFDPPLAVESAPQTARLMHALHARHAHAHYQPESTLVLDLKHEPEELLRRMKPKGRYNIKVAQKHGVSVRVSDGNEADIEAFYALLSQTADRDSFSSHPLAYYKDMLKTLGSRKARLYLASHAGKVLAGMIVTYFRDTATYYFGASSSENRHTMAPYLLHWRAISDARAAGCHYYDFFGIAPENQPDHPWQKVTDFKLKFGGERINYFPAQEIVYKPFWYALIKLAKRLRGLI